MPEEIHAGTTIGKAIRLKGEPAGELMDNLFCRGQKGCCPRTSLCIGYAARLRKKEAQLPKLLADLNALPDVC